MAYPQVIIPPSVKPVSPLELAPADDQTVPFQPRFARGTTQRQTWGDPVWSAQVRFESLSGADRALVKAAIMGARGGAANILMTPGIPLRGSFPATELLTNNDFSNGTTGWSPTSGNTLSANDRVLRATKIQGGLGTDAYQTATVTQYAPYAVRIFYGVPSSSGSVLTVYSNDAVYSSTSALPTGAGGLGTLAKVPLTTALTCNGYDSYGGGMAGDYWEMRYASISRCIPADGGANLLIYSDQIDNAAYTKTGCSVTANAATAPDGTSTADAIVEDSSTGVHRVYIDKTVSSSALEYCLSVAVKAGTRSYVALQLDESTGSTSVVQYFSLSTGAVGTSSVGANWSNLRAFSVDAGNGWYILTIVARKTSAATTVTTQIRAASADGTSSYTGTASASAIFPWRATLAQSSVPVRLMQSTSTAVTASSQTSSTIYVKGLPASTSGLLLAGDFVEINGELMQVTASLDSNASGLGVLQIHRRPTTAIADNTPIIVNNPFGTFRLASDPRITERFGVYTDVDLQLIEATA